MGAWVPPKPSRNSVRRIKNGRQAGPGEKMLRLLTGLAKPSKGGS